MVDGMEWLHIEASSTRRLFRVGEMMHAGETLGDSVHGGTVKASLDGQVAEIQYDIDSNEIILAVVPACCSCAA